MDILNLYHFELFSCVKTPWGGGSCSLEKTVKCCFQVHLVIISAPCPVPCRQFTSVLFKHIDQCPKRIRYTNFYYELGITTTDGS